MPRNDPIKNETIKHNPRGLVNNQLALQLKSSAGEIYHAEKKEKQSIECIAQSAVSLFRGNE